VIRIEAFAKLNYGLRVGPRRADGFHSIRSRFQSISVSDELSVAFAESDSITSKSGGPVPAGDQNLAWRAVDAVRSAVAGNRPVAVILDKHIPVGAGLGGGSADCAAALFAASDLFGATDEVVASLAPTLGSDVPFCLQGGYAEVTGRGEDVRGLKPVGGYALALVVPPAELSTPAVYRQWDEMGGPRGSEVDGRSLPTALRGEDFCNDLVPAAFALSAAVADWHAELRSLWGQDVLMSGSGSTLFAFATEPNEAADMLRGIPVGARFTGVAEPVATGWSVVHPA
jgi:4-diphosphocytidyl-2-C-methyl-D-erythritol kinase